VSAPPTQISTSRSSFLDTIAYGLRYCGVTNAPLTGDYLRMSITKTNGTTVVVSVTNTPGGATTSSLTQQLVDAINATTSLQAPDGVVAEDSVGYDPYGYFYAEFNLRARTAGWNAAQIQIAFTGSPTFVLIPSGTQHADGNLSDLQPRNHLYVTAGVTNLPLAFAFISALVPDGYHELTAVAYEGSHVRTQKRIAQTVRVQNSPLSAVFTTLVGGTNTALEATLQFSVVANTNTISKIELFSTGGSLGSVSSQSSANFSVAGTNMGLGLHAFYAIVTANSGKQYRTDTKWIRLVSGPQAPFKLLMTGPPPTVNWPAIAGRSYNILSTTNLTNAFLLRASLTATTSAGQWIEPSPSISPRFYRVQTN